MSVFPAKSGGYILPVKAEVRRKADIAAGELSDGEPGTAGRRLRGVSVNAPCSRSSPASQYRAEHRCAGASLVWPGAPGSICSGSR